MSRRPKSRRPKSKPPKSKPHQATSTAVGAPSQQERQQERPRTAEDHANEQTAEALALRIWAAMVGAKVLKDMSVLMDELLQSHLLDDDDEEGDESWLDDQQKRHKNLLDEQTGSANILISPPSVSCRSIPI